MKWENLAGVVAIGLLIVALLLYLAGAETIAGFPLADAGQFASGYLAAGDFAAGVFSAGIFASGIFAAGIFSIGIFSIGIFSFGIYAVGLYAAQRYIRASKRAKTNNIHKANEFFTCDRFTAESAEITKKDDLFANGLF